MRIGAAFIRWEHRYGWVLLLILCSLVFQLAVPDQDWARVVTIALQGGALVLALYASQARPLIARLTTLVVTLAVLGSAAALVGFGEFGTTAGWVVAALLVALAPLVIVRGVVRGVRTEGSVTHLHDVRSPVHLPAARDAVRVRLRPGRRRRNPSLSSPRESTRTSPTTCTSASRP